MKISTVVFLIFLILFSISCSRSSSTVDKKDTFNKFLRKFKQIDTPINIKLSDDNIFKGSLSIDPNSLDTLFINPYGNFITYGYIRDTSKFYILIYAVIGDMPNFKIATFDKNYNLIADTSILNMDGCVLGSPCLNCDTEISINSSSSIETRDFLNYLDCDSLGNSNDSIVERAQLLQSILINENGKIIINKN